MRILKLALPLALACLATAAAASGSGAPFGYTPDPTLKTASATELEGRVKRSCASTQAKVQNVADTSVERPCGCYATRVMKSLDTAEIESYRNTGVFNESARAKALAAVDQCKLKRPI